MVIFLFATSKGGAQDTWKIFLVPDLALEERLFCRAALIVRTGGGLADGQPFPALQGQG